ncbi:MAG: helix-turn-helix transcriptional regulator [Bacilli bacterium]|nr:helix-turn-helix transcriptional regulator [Bacilli bacterium]
MEIIYVEENGKLFGSTKALGIGKRQPELIYGKQARRLRETAGLTIDELANEFKMKSVDLERLENQRQALTEKIFEKYSKKFDVKKEYFFETDLETLLLTAEGHVIKNFKSGAECLNEFNKLKEQYFECLNNKTKLIIDYTK